MNPKLLTALTMALLFTACGSSDSKGKSITEQFKDIEYLVIVYEVSEDSCKVSSLKENIDGGQFGNLFIVPKNGTIDKSTLISQFNNNNNIDCSTFNRATDDECLQYDNSETTGVLTGTSCSVGFKTK
jgi:hypothetical protein